MSVVLVVVLVLGSSEVFAGQIRISGPNLNFSGAVNNLYGSFSRIIILAIGLRISIWDLEKYVASFRKPLEKSSSKSKSKTDYSAPKRKSSRRNRSMPLSAGRHIFEDKLNNTSRAKMKGNMI